MWTRRAAVAGLGAALAMPRAALAAGADDIALLRRAYTTLHPGLYRYGSPGQVGRRFDALARAFDAGDDVAARYLALSRMLATIRCGHSYANFSNQSKRVQQALFAGRDKLPLRFRWLGAGAAAAMVVTDDPWDTGVTPGSRILMLNGRPAAAILGALMTVARADGGNDAKRRALMSVTGRDRVESFDVFHPLLFGRSERFDLLVEAPDGRRRTATLAAIDLAGRQGKRAAADRADRGWRFERVGQTAVMTLPDWGFYDDAFDWRGWLAARFEEMGRADVRGLVVDVRGNEGGRDCGNAIIARLIDAPLPGEGMRRLVRFQTVPDDLPPTLLDTWDQSFRRLGEGAPAAGGGYYALSDPDDDSGSDSVIRPLGPRFRGRVAVLTDAANSSATYGFARRVQAARLGTIVGGETGGNRRGINGGAFFFVRLAESGLEADLPLIGTFPPQPAPDQGVKPDVPVPVTIADIRAGGDPALDRALRLVRA